MLSLEVRGLLYPELPAGLPCEFRPYMGKLDSTNNPQCQLVPTQLSLRLGRRTPCKRSVNIDSSGNSQYKQLQRFQYLKVT